MKNLIPVAIGILLMAASCGSKETGMTENDMKFKVDSLVGERTPDLMMQSSVDLDRRMSIEVKPKADSIFNAWIAAGKP